MTGPRIAACGLAALAAWAGANVSSGQEQERPAVDSGLRERVEVSLVLVEVVALDRGGRHVRGLKKEDFVVREAGTPLPIVTFDEVDFGEAPAEAVEPPVAEVAEPAPEQAPPAAPAAPAAPSEEHQRRTFLLLFDGYNNASALHLAQARRAAKKFLKTNLRQDDVAAIYEISPYLRSVTALSQDLAYLEDAVDEIRWFPGESLANQISDATMYYGRIGSRDEIWDRMMNSARFGADRATAERRQYFDSLAALGRVLEGLPGRKVVVLFSGGFPMLLSREEMSSGGFGADYRAMMRQLERARATVYSMNIGEEPMLVDASVASTYRDTLDYLGYGAPAEDQLGRGVGMGGSSSAAYNQFMAVLAHETGGRFFAGYDYGQSLESVDDDTRHYYLIGYEPPSAKRAGRYRGIDISVARKGVRVQTRQGRFTADPAESRLAARADEPPPSPRPGPLPRPAASGEALGAPPPAEGHSLRAMPVFFPLADGRTLVGLSLELVGAVAAPESREGQLMLDISSHLVARSGGEEVGRSDHDFRSNLRAEARGPLLRGLRVVDAIALAPGSYDLAANLRLNGLDIAADWQGPLEVPAVERGALGLGGMTLLADEQAAPLVADVFVADGTSPGLLEAGVDDPFRLDTGWRVIAAASPRVVRGSRPIFFFRVYGAEVGAESGLPDGLELDYTLVPADGGAEILPAAELGYFRAAPGGGGAFDVLVRLDLGLAEPGAYRLRVDARDRRGERSARSSRPLEIVD